MNVSGRNPLISSGRVGSGTLVIGRLLWYVRLRMAGIRLYNDQTGEYLGELDEEDLQFLIEQMEEEDAEDRAYYINQDTITMLRANGAGQGLLALLEDAIARTGEAEVRWSEE